MSKVHIKLFPITKFILVTCFCKKAKDWKRLETSQPFFQHQINGLHTHVGCESHPQVTGSPFKTKQTSFSSRPPHYLYVRIMQGQKFSSYALQIKMHRSRNGCSFMAIYRFQVIKGFLARAGGRQMLITTFWKVSSSKVSLKYCSSSTWRKSCATCFLCCNNSMYTESTNIYKDLLFLSIS